MTLRARLLSAMCLRCWPIWPQTNCSRLDLRHTPASIASSAAPRVYEVLELTSGCTRAVESTALLDRELTCASPAPAGGPLYGGRLGGLPARIRKGNRRGRESRLRRRFLRAGVFSMASSFSSRAWSPLRVLCAPAEYRRFPGR